MAKLLHSYGAEIDLVAHNETPLLLAIKSRRLKLFDWLLQSGANIDFQGEKGHSGLSYAIKRKYTGHQVKMLLAHGADPLLKASDGSTPLSFAMDQRRTMLVALLSDHAR